MLKHLQYLSIDPHDSLAPAREDQDIDLSGLKSLTSLTFFSPAYYSVDLAVDETMLVLQAAPNIIHLQSSIFCWPPSTERAVASLSFNLRSLTIPAVARHSNFSDVDLIRLTTPRNIVPAGKAMMQDLDICVVGKVTPLCLLQVITRLAPSLRRLRIRLGDYSDDKEHLDALVQVLPRLTSLSVFRFGYGEWDGEPPVQSLLPALPCKSLLEFTFEFHQGPWAPYDANITSTTMQQVLAYDFLGLKAMKVILPSHYLASSVDEAIWKDAAKASGFRFAFAQNLDFLE